ncbi:arginine--tRNA ligase [Candidatus Woesearchaeota archaeon]|nr:arginine--tRNA ligase [Candidatus Woesearchaeota archaeon]
MQEKIIELLKKYANLKEINLEIPPSPELGDFAFPCFQLAKIQKKDPVEISLALSKEIKLIKGLEKIQALGPYLNFFVDKSMNAELILKEILTKKGKYGSRNLGKNKPFLVEHTSINPNASPHLGRARNAILGGSISSLLKFQNYKVQTHYYVNDVGKQIALLVLGCRKNTRFNQLLKIYIQMNKKLEADKNLEREVFGLLKKFEDGDKATIKRFKNTVDICIKGQKAILKELGIEYDLFDYESKYLFNKQTNNLLEKLKSTKRLFEDEESRFVLDQSGFNLAMKTPYLVLTRSDKTSLYPLRDIAYTIEKMKKAKNNLVILGEDQKLYFQQLKAALSLLNHPSPEVLHYSFVLLSTGKMSTRKGNLVLLEDFMKKAVKKAEKKSSKKIAKSVAYAAIKYSLLRVSNDKNVVFDWDQALSFEGETGPYLQYTYARSYSILRKSKFKNNKINFSLLREPAEIELIKKLGAFSEIIEKASSKYQPHLLANYLFLLCQNFNEFYHKYSVLKAEKEVKEARLILVKAVNQVLKTGLKLLGINPIEKM